MVVVNSNRSHIDDNSKYRNEVLNTNRGPDIQHLKQKFLYEFSIIQISKATKNPSNIFFYVDTKTIEWRYLWCVKVQP